MNIDDVSYQDASPEILELFHQALPGANFTTLEFVFMREHKTVLRGKAHFRDEERYFVATISPEEVSKTWVRKAVRKIRRRFSN